MEHNYTDIIIICAFAFFLIRGFLKGFLRALIGPVSLISAICLAVYYYIETENHLIASAVGFFGPFVIHLVLSLILKIWDKSFNEEKTLSFFSRVFGAGISLLVSGTFLLCMILLILFIPKGIPKVGAIQDNILASKGYGIIHAFLGEKIDATSSKINRIVNILRDPDKLEKMLASSKLAENKTFQNFVNDQETKKQLKEKDLAQIAKNPKMLELLKDKDAIKSIFAFQKQFIQENLDKNSLLESDDESFGTLRIENN